MQKKTLGFNFLHITISLLFLLNLPTLSAETPDQTVTLWGSCNLFVNDWVSYESVGLLDSGNIAPNCYLNAPNLTSAQTSGLGYTYGSAWNNIRDGLMPANPSWYVMQQISAGAHGHVWAIDLPGNVYYRAGVTPLKGANNSGAYAMGTRWQQVNGSFRNIAVCPNGDVWGVNTSGEVVYADSPTYSTVTGSWGFNNQWVRSVTQGSTQVTWQTVPGFPATSISVGARGTVWAVDTISGKIAYRKGITESTPMGTAWQTVNPPTSTVPTTYNRAAANIAATPDGGVWVVTEPMIKEGPYSAGGQAYFNIKPASKNIYYAAAPTISSPGTVVWKQPSDGGALMQITVDPAGILWGVNVYGAIFSRQGITASNPIGTSWSSAVNNHPGNPGNIFWLSAGMTQGSPLAPIVTLPLTSTATTTTITAPAPAPTIAGIPTALPVTAAPVTYGSTVRIAFPAIAGAGLHSHTLKYTHAGSSMQQQVTGSMINDANDLWIVRGSLAQGDSYQIGQAVPNGARIRLIHQATGGRLHNHEEAITKSSDATMLEVTGLNGGNTGDDWIIQTSNGAPWSTTSLVTLRPATVNASYYLTAKTTTYPELSGQRVVGLNVTPAAYWQVISVTPPAAQTTPAPTGIPTALPVTAAPVTYGSTVRIAFPSIAEAGLHSHTLKYTHAGSSMQQQVTGSMINDANDLWIVRGSLAQGDSYQVGQPVPNGARIRLIHKATGGRLHNHEESTTKSPDSTMLEVTGLNGGNTGDDWIIQTSNGAPWSTTSLVTLRPATVNAGYYLTAKTTTYPELSGQRVVGLNVTPAAYWQVISVTPPA